MESFEKPVFSQVDTMIRDITAILEEWPFEPGQISARMIQAEDGEPRIQIRLDLGLLQMHTEGRPDGQEPNGFRSLLDYFEAMEEAGRREDFLSEEEDGGEHGEFGSRGRRGGRSGGGPGGYRGMSGRDQGYGEGGGYQSDEGSSEEGKRGKKRGSSGAFGEKEDMDEGSSAEDEGPLGGESETSGMSDGLGGGSLGGGGGGGGGADGDRGDGGEGGSESGELKLGPEESRALREELAQYNQRALAMLAMEHFDCVVRDCSRNLRAMDLCKRASENAEDQTMLEQYRPYILMMRYRALASQALKDNEPKAALIGLDEGLSSLKACYAELGKAGAYEQSTEVQMLKSMRDQLVPKLPLSQRAELKQRLAEAVAAENYELAAILRDELKQLKD